MPLKKPISKTKNMVVQEFEKEILLYDLISNKAFCLNETSAMIWQLCDGNKSISEISRQLSKHFKADLDEGVVWLAIEQFKRDELLDKTVPIEIDFGGLSRRQVIKKVGLASLIALPLISSVVAPNAVMAKSVGIALLDACPTGSGCESGLFCRNCNNGSCDGSLTCCHPSNGGFGPGATFCTNAPTCSQGVNACCSGMTEPRSSTCPNSNFIPCRCL